MIPFEGGGERIPTAHVAAAKRRTTKIGSAVTQKDPVDWSGGDQPTPPKMNWYASASQDNYYKKTPDLTKPGPATIKPNMQNAAKRKINPNYA